MYEKTTQNTQMDKENNWNEENFWDGCSAFVILLIDNVKEQKMQLMSVHWAQHIFLASNIKLWTFEYKVKYLWVWVLTMSKIP